MFPKRKSKYLKMLQNYTANRPQANYNYEIESPTENLGQAWKDLQQISKGVDQFNLGMQKMKNRIGYNKPKQELVVKKLSEMVNPSVVEDISPTKLQSKGSKDTFNTGNSLIR